MKGREVVRGEGEGEGEGASESEGAVRVAMHGGPGAGTLCAGEVRAAAGSHLALRVASRIDEDREEVAPPRSLARSGGSARLGLEPSPNRV